MAQHHSLSAAATKLSIGELYRMSDNDAHALLVQMRWPNGHPICPRCEHEKVYAYSNKRQWKCARCRHKFSVTSSTLLFHSRKLRYQEYLVAIAHFVHAETGISALRLRRELSVSYKTALTIAHKLREIMGHQVHSQPDLSGIVEIDGAYFGALERPENVIADRPDRRRNTAKTKKLVVFSIRERWGGSLAYVLPREADARPLILNRVIHGSTIHADSANEWNRLIARYPLKRVNHKREMVSKDGASVNWCESYNARIKRGEYGVYYRIFGHYLAQYANEFAWRENHRFLTSAAKWRRILGGGLNLPRSRIWCGYWQRQRRIGDFYAIPGVPEVLAVVPDFRDVLAGLAHRAAHRRAAQLRATR